MRTKIGLVILAGGKSTRFGAPKARAKLGEISLLEHVYQRAVAQNAGPVAVNTNNPIDLDLDADIITDAFSADIGPLAGLHAGLKWANSHNLRSIVTLPVDTPFLPANLITRFQQVSLPAYAMSGARKHPLIGHWSIASLQPLENAILAGLRSGHAWLERSDAQGVVFENIDGVDPFFNINTKADLEQARQLMQRL